ncbi:hypothetical protein BpHYR1_037848 [Brachionus plicatilis]|uniref:Uncharacterized protein n=1 Tax=Brachionus plicatilis TaxID=10195 RepID=A0A3M7RR42_BRAPC|nr:hypothetical protein BpHYR1_037848 [Brachionus plicatilis]
MNQFERQLENFVVDLSLIDKDNSQQPDYEKLADYILSGSGWTTLQQTKKNKNDINFIFADKFNDLLLEYCSKLLLHLPSTSKYMSSNLSEAGYGSLNDFINISLDLFLKFHDGATKTIYDTNSPALMNFSDVLFNQSKQDKNVLSYFKFIYLKFLHKIYKNNFENMSKKYAGRNFQNFIKPQTALNKHFQEQFKIIAKSLSNSEDLKIFYTNLLVNYIYDFMILTGFSATKSHIANVSSIFSHLIALLDQVCEFVLDSLIKFELDDFKSIWKRLSQLLLELKDYRNKIEHNQSCLRKKHNSHECKKSIHGSNPRHNDITSVKSECVMKKIFIKMLKLLNSGEKSALVFELVEKLGICNCTRLEEFIEENVGFKQGLILPILDYLFSLLTDSDTLVVKRRSIFFPLLVDNSLIELDQTSTNINEHLNKNIFKSIETILVQMSAKSLILVNYLTGGLKKFAKYVQINKEEKSENSINQTILYKYMIAEVFYMQKGMLKLLAEKDADETKSKLFNAVCGYIKEMLALIGSVELLNFDGSLLKASDSMLIKDCYTSSQEELEMNINKKFTDFMHKNSANIYELVDKLSKKYDHDLLDPMTICALMIKYKHDIHGENSTRHLCKSIIDTIDLNPNLFGNQSAILIILDLYIKSAIFRTALNDCQHFHLGLLNSFNLYFDSDPSEQNKDLNEIYVCMRNKLDSNVSWLMVFFNVFKINQSVPSSQNLPNQEIYLNKNEQSIPNDYEGDSECFYIKPSIAKITLSGISRIKIFVKNFKLCKYKYLYVSIILNGCNQFLVKLDIIIVRIVKNK